MAVSKKKFIDIFVCNLKKIMDEKNISVNDLAKKSNLNSSTIYKYLNKDRMPGTIQVLNLSLSLGCKFSDLIPVNDYIK